MVKVTSVFFFPLFSTALVKASDCLKGVPYLSEGCLCDNFALSGWQISQAPELSFNESFDVTELVYQVSWDPNADPYSISARSLSKASSSSEDKSKPWWASSTSSASSSSDDNLAYPDRRSLRAHLDNGAIGAKRVSKTIANRRRLHSEVFDWDTHTYVTQSDSTSSWDSKVSSSSHSSSDSSSSSSQSSDSSESSSNSRDNWRALRQARSAGDCSKLFELTKVTMLVDGCCKTPTSNLLATVPTLTASDSTFGSLSWSMLLSGFHRDSSNITLTLAGEWLVDELTQGWICIRGNGGGGCACRKAWLPIRCADDSAPTASPTRSRTTRSPATPPISSRVELPTNPPTRTPLASPAAGLPTRSPTSVPTAAPSRVDITLFPTGGPTVAPTAAPSRIDITSGLTAFPTRSPTEIPSESPTGSPSKQPTQQPTESPTRYPTRYPTVNPSANPSSGPTQQPSEQPSDSPSKRPSNPPSSAPSRSPTAYPSRGPSVAPSSAPSGSPSTNPSAHPTADPSTMPSGAPSRSPLILPTFIAIPSRRPTANPSKLPSVSPTGHPSRSPSVAPTAHPIANPSGSPSEAPSDAPSVSPSTHPTDYPSSGPTAAPSRKPSPSPSSFPTVPPSASPTDDPSASPSLKPTAAPSDAPTDAPSLSPTQSSELTGMTTTAMPETTASKLASQCPPQRPSNPSQRVWCEFSYGGTTFGKAGVSSMPSECECYGITDSSLVDEPLCCSQNAQVAICGTDSALRICEDGYCYRLDGRGNQENECAVRYTPIVPDTATAASACMSAGARQFRSRMKKSPAADAVLECAFQFGNATVESSDCACESVCCSTETMPDVCGEDNLHFCEDGLCRSRDSENGTEFNAFSTTQVTESTTVSGSESDPVHFSGDGAGNAMQCSGGALPTADIDGLFGIGRIIDENGVVSYSELLTDVYTSTTGMPISTTEATSVIVDDCSAVESSWRDANARVQCAMSLATVGSDGTTSPLPTEGECRCGLCCTTGSVLGVCGGFQRLCSDGNCYSIGQLPALNCRVSNRPVSRVVEEL